MKTPVCDSEKIPSCEITPFLFFFFSPSIFSSTRKSFLHARKRNKRKRYTVCRIYVVEDMNEEIGGEKIEGEVVFQRRLYGVSGKMVEQGGWKGTILRRERISFSVARSAEILPMHSDRFGSRSWGAGAFDNNTRQGVLMEFLCYFVSLWCIKILFPFTPCSIKNITKFHCVWRKSMNKIV